MSYISSKDLPSEIICSKVKKGTKGLKYRSVANNILAKMSSVLDRWSISISHERDNFSGFRILTVDISSHIFLFS